MIRSKLVSSTLQIQIEPLTVETILQFKHNFSLLPMFGDRCRHIFTRSLVNHDWHLFYVLFSAPVVMEIVLDSLNNLFAVENCYIFIFNVMEILFVLQQKQTYKLFTFLFPDDILWFVYLFVNFTFLDNLCYACQHEISSNDLFCHGTVSVNFYLLGLLMRL